MRGLRFMVLGFRGLGLRVGGVWGLRGSGFRVLGIRVLRVQGFGILPAGRRRKL